MSGSGSPELDLTGAAGLRVAVIATRWHAEITDALLAGALAALADAGVRSPTVVRAPGAFELPVLAQAAAATHDAVVCLGLVIRGGTPHFEYVCNAVTDGCTRVALDTGVPVGFGVLTCDDEQQARDRAGLAGSRESKGREAVEAALVTALALVQLRAAGGPRTPDGRGRVGPV